MPKRVDHEQRRGEIAVALMRVAARDGLEGISLRHVAAEAGVTSGMVQHYFPTKDAMMHFAMDAASESFAGPGDARRDDSAGEAATIEEQIFTLLHALLPTDDRKRDAGMTTLAFMAYAATNRAAAAKLAWGETRLRAHISGLLRTARDEARLAAGVDPDAAAAAVLATTDGLGLHCLTGGLEPAAASAALRQQVNLLFGGGRSV